MSVPVRRLAAPFAVAATLFAVNRCSSSSDDGGGPGPTATTLAQVSGNNQTGVVTLPLGAPLVVRATDDAGTAVSGVTVTFGVSGGGGTVNPTSATTGSNGQAQATFTLGNTAGTGHTATATATGLSGSPITFSATALSASIAIQAGNNQSGTTQQALTNPLVVILRDQNNNPVSGKTVAFGIASGGGSANPASAVSGANGQAQTVFTPGCTVGNQSVNALATGFSGSPVTFQAAVALSTSAAPVSVLDNSFSPATTTICAGQQVTWTWNGSNTHNVTFGGGGPANCGNQTTGTCVRPFPTAGTFNYTCTNHAGMAGTVTVQ